MYQTSCACTISLTPIFPDKTVGMSSATTIGISYEIITATWRNEPSRANLLFDDQPAMMIESVPSEPTPIRYSTPTFKSTPKRTGASGRTAHNNSTDIIISTGARLNTTLSTPMG